MKKLLTHPLLGDREFDADHADRILSYPMETGWKIKEDAPGDQRAKRKAREEAKEGDVSKGSED